jgi:predicted phosphoribosyltransferase
MFRDRAEAGCLLARRLAAFAADPGVVILALPRGGVPVGYEVASALQVTLDVFVVRKLGVPGHGELAMGAIASGGVRVLNPEVVEALGLPDDAIEAVARFEHAELKRRERLYRGDRGPLGVRARTSILIDDGLATGSTMRAAAQALRRLEPARIVIAVPVAPPDVCAALRAAADEVICLATPEPFLAVGLWYQQFEQTSDDEVRRLLAAARAGHAPAGAPQPQ